MLSYIICCELAQHYNFLNLWLTSSPQTMKTSKPRFFPQGFLAGYSGALHVTTCSPTWMEYSVSMWKPGQLESCSQIPPVCSTSQILIYEASLCGRKKKVSLRWLILWLAIQGTLFILVFRFWGRNSSGIRPQTIFTHQIYSYLNYYMWRFCCPVDDLRLHFRYIFVVI